MYIITGAAGQVGRMAAEELLDHVPSSEVILTTRSPEKLSDLAERGASVRFADFSDPETLPGAFAGAQRMLLLSTSSVGSRVLHHNNALQAAKNAGITYVAYTSIVGAGNPENTAVVSREHRSTEKALRESGMAWNALRDSQYAEALAYYIAPGAIMTGKWLGAQGQGRIGLVARADCAAAAIGCLLGRGEDNRAYAISGPELLTYSQVADMVTEISGHPITTVDITDEEQYAIFDEMGVPRQHQDDMSASPIPWNSDDMVSFSRAIRLGHMADFSDAVQQLSGRSPRSVRSILEEASASWPSPVSSGAVQAERE